MQLGRAVFICPECRGPGLNITAGIELRHSAWDDFALQVVVCSGCDFKGAALYCESRRGALDFEVVDHTGFRLEKAVADWLEEVIAACPEPGDDRCDCRSHQLLNTRCGPRGEWPDGYLAPRDQQFAMTFGNEW